MNTNRTDGIPAQTPTGKEKHPASLWRVWNEGGQEAGSLSATWRKNTSICEPVELANLLRALRKVAGHLGPNVGSIEYAGMSQSGETPSIILEPVMVMGRYPVPAEKVDALVGLVTHEAFHRIEWSDHVWRLLEPAFSSMGGLSRVCFQKVVHTGEDIYVDLAASKTVFGLYLPMARMNGLFPAEERIRPPGGISVDALIVLWWTTTWSGRVSPQEPAVYKRPLGVLRGLTQNLRQVRDGSKGVTARCEQRADLYLKTWQDLESTLSGWKVMDKRLYWFPSPPGRGTETPQRNPATQPAVKALAPTLARQVQRELALGSADITPIIRDIVGYDNEDVVPTSRWDFHIPAHPVVDKRLVSRLRGIFQGYSARKSLVSRGLVSGKMDRRRLYRAPCSGRCFHRVDRLPNLDWTVTLLMDASGSMRGNKWRMVENTVANLHRALKAYQNRLQAYAYFEVDGVCMISRLLRDRQLLSVPPSGQTASGQALIAVAYFMPKSTGRNLLIHVTDGESNFGCDVQYGIDYCRSRKIHLVTLGCGCRDRQAMHRQYGKTLQFLTHFGQLPQAMERLLKWTFLYGAKPHLWGGNPFWAGAEAS